VEVPISNYKKSVANFLATGKNTLTTLRRLGLLWTNVCESQHFTTAFGIGI